MTPFDTDDPVEAPKNMTPDATASTTHRIHDPAARHILVLIVDALPEIKKHADAIVAATNAQPGNKPMAGGPPPDVPSLALHAQALNTEFRNLALRVSRAKTPKEKGGHKAKQTMLDALFGLERSMGDLVAATRFGNSQKSFALAQIKKAQQDLGKAQTEGQAALAILKR